MSGLEEVLVERDEQKHDEEWDKLKRRYQATLSTLLSSDRHAEDQDNIVLSLQSDSQLAAHAQAIRDTADWGVAESILDRTILLRSRTHDTAAQVVKSTGIRWFWEELKPSLLPEHNLLPMSCKRAEGNKPFDVDWATALLNHNCANTVCESVHIALRHC